MKRPTLAYWLLLSALGAIAIGSAVYAMPLDVLMLALLLLLSVVVVAGGIIYTSEVKSLDNYEPTTKNEIAARQKMRAELERKMGR